MLVQSLAMFLPALPYGGAERVAVNLAHEFVDKGIKVTFVLQHATGDLMSELPPEVNVVELNCRRTLACIFPLMRFLDKERPDILLSHLSHNNIVSIWAGQLAHTHTRVIVVQHNALSTESQQHKGWQYKLLPILYRMFIGYAHGIVAVSTGVAHDLVRVSRLPQQRVKVLSGASLRPDFSTARREAAVSARRPLYRPPQAETGTKPRRRSF